MKQKILHISTMGNDLRSSVDGISAEDGELIKMDKEIGFSKDMWVPFYKTVMHAIGDGWRLMSPPIKIDTNYYDWWLEK